MVQELFYCFEKFDVTHRKLHKKNLDITINYSLFVYKYIYALKGYRQSTFLYPNGLSEAKIPRIDLKKK